MADFPQHVSQVVEVFMCTDCHRVRGCKEEKGFNDIDTGWRVWYCHIHNNKTSPACVLLYPCCPPSPLTNKQPPYTNTKYNHHHHGRQNAPDEDLVDRLQRLRAKFRAAASMVGVSVSFSLRRPGGGGGVDGAGTQQGLSF